MIKTAVQPVPACVPIPRPIRHTILLATSYNLTGKIHAIGMIVRAGNEPKRVGPIIDRVGEAHWQIQAANVQVFAILRALELANRMGWRNVRVNSDYPNRDQLNRHYYDRTGMDDAGLIGAILRLAITFDDVQFRHATRRKNLEATKLARAACGNKTKAKVVEDESMAWWEIGIEAEISAAQLAGSE